MRNISAPYEYICMNLTLNAKTRNVAEKSTAKPNKDELKAVVYGHGLPSRSLTVSSADYARLYRLVKQATLFDLVVDGAAPVKVLIHDIQVNPVNMIPVHIDFRQIRMDEAIKVTVPLVFTGEAQAIKALGGTLVKALDEIEVECLPDRLPKEIIVDLSSLNTFEDTVTIKDIKLPEGVTTDLNQDDAVAKVEAPMSDEEYKKIEQGEAGDVTAIKTEAEEKKAKEAEAKAAEEAAK